MLNPALCRRDCCIHNIIISVLLSFRFTVLVNYYNVQLYIHFVLLIISAILFYNAYSQITFMNSYFYEYMYFAIYLMLMYTMPAYYVLTNMNDLTQHIKSVSIALHMFIYQKHRFYTY